MMKITLNACVTLFLFTVDLSLASTILQWIYFLIFLLIHFMVLDLQ